MASARIAFSFIALATIAPVPVLAETISTGTGFAVTFDGVIVTNNHVVDRCGAIRARFQGATSDFYEARVIAQDRAVDLAAVKIVSRVRGGRRTSFRELPRASLREDPTLLLGEHAITFGFPMRGILSTEGNLTFGYVTALRGLADNPNYVQISTPVQPGNSGGALFDGSGNVIGVVAEKLNALAIMRMSGDVPQNVNFAVTLLPLRRFLVKNNINILEQQSTAERPMKEIGTRAQLFTYLIECEAQPRAK